MHTRPAIESDARGIAEVHVETWRAAYRGIVPEEYLNSLSVDKREAVWRELLAHGPAEVWVAESGMEIAGWVAFGASRDSDAPPNAGELQAIYVRPEYWSVGVGRELWLLARRRLIELGFGSATLWVLIENARAIRFYAAAGFMPNIASEKDLTLGGKLLKEVRYKTSFG